MSVSRAHAGRSQTRWALADVGPDRESGCDGGADAIPGWARLTGGLRIFSLQSRLMFASPKQVLANARAEVTQLMAGSFEDGNLVATVVGDMSELEYEAACEGTSTFGGLRQPATLVSGEVIEPTSWPRRRAVCCWSMLEPFEGTDPFVVRRTPDGLFGDISLRAVGGTLEATLNEHQRARTLT